jgi:hypothetical protein
MGVRIRPLPEEGGALQLCLDRFKESGDRVINGGGEVDRIQRRGIEFSEMGINDLDLVLNINRTGLSSSSPNCSDEIVLEKLLDNEAMKSQWDISSFVVHYNGLPVASTILCVVPSKRDGRESVLYVDAMVVLSEIRGVGLGKKMFLKILEFSAKTGLPIEMMCRESTSYAALKGIGGNLLGFNLIFDEGIKFEREGEAYYFARIEKT